MRKRLFKHWGFKLPLLLCVLTVSLIIASGVALAGPSTAIGTIGNFTGAYYNFPLSSPDLEGNITQLQQGWVNDTLTGGLPTLTAAGATNIHDFTWWSGTPVLTRNDGDLSAIPEQNWFPTRPALGPTAANGYNGYFAVHWTTQLNVTTAGTFGFNMGSDDDSWLFVTGPSYPNGHLVLDLGGVHAWNATDGSINLPVGTYTVDIFYAERHTVQAGFSFTTSIPTHPGTESFPILSATPSYFEQ